MKTIWKYLLPTNIEPGQPFYLKMRKGDQYLSTSYIQGAQAMWWKVDKSEAAHTRTFVCYYTGQLLYDENKNLVFLGTFTRGPLVHHLFEVTE